MTSPRVLSKYNNDKLTDRLAFRVEFWSDMGIGHVMLRPVYIREDGETLGYFYDAVYDGEGIFSGLEITCQYNQIEHKYIEAHEPYAFKTGYSTRTFGVGNLEVSEMRVKFLRWLNSQLEKVHTQTGIRCHEDDISFGQYVKIVTTILSGGEPVLVRAHRQGYGFDRIYTDVETLVNHIVATETWHDSRI